MLVSPTVEDKVTIKTVSISSNCDQKKKKKKKKKQEKKPDLITEEFVNK